MSIPEAVAQLLLALERGGFQAYVVGGCVRDLLLGRPVHDWDITTSARPEQMMQLFSHVVPTGLRHGTVTVFQGGLCAEVTTFRREDGYLDGRHPEQVEFVDSLQEDLARRDFTINAMAMDRSGGLTDLFGGREDLRRGCIRCVGVPEQRFGEDALRMFRAVRFSAQLGFAIEPVTEAAITCCSDQSRLISRERIRDELEKILCSDAPQTVSRLVELGLLRHLGLDQVCELPLRPGLTDDLTVRWALFAAAYGTQTLAQLRLPRVLVRTATAAARQLLQAPAPMPEVLSRLGLAAARCYAELSGRQKELQDTLSSGVCWNLNMLAVDGRDFPQVSGPALGALLQALLEHVLRHPEDNTRPALLRRAQRIATAELSRPDN